MRLDKRLSARTTPSLSSHATEPICQSLRHSRPHLIGEVRDKRCQNVHTPRIYHGGPINLGLEFVMSFSKITDTRQGLP